MIFPSFQPLKPKKLHNNSRLATKQAPSKAPVFLWILRYNDSYTGGAMSRDYCDYLIDQLAAWGTVTARRMFGGYGI